MKDQKHAYDFITGSNTGGTGWSQAQADCLAVTGSPLALTPYGSGDSATLTSLIQSLWTTAAYNFPIQVPDYDVNGDDFISGYHSPALSGSAYDRIHAYELRYGDPYITI